MNDCALCGSEFHLSKGYCEQKEEDVNCKIVGENNFDCSECFEGFTIGRLGERDFCLEEIENCSISSIFEGCL